MCGGEVCSAFGGGGGVGNNDMNNMNEPISSLKQ